jgi:hypothetical protein
MKETDLAMAVNNATYSDYYNRLKILATSLFIWDGLDDVAGYGASRFLELALFEDGKATFLKDPTRNFMALRVNPNDKPNIYDIPTKVLAYSFEFNKQYDIDDVVYIMNNNLQKPTFETLQLFAYRLFDTERTIDVNLIAQKTPILIEGDTKTILTLKNVYMQYSGNTPFIFGSKQFDLNNRLSVLNTNAPYLIDKLELHKHEIWNEALTYLGINNSNTDKKERLITDEVNSNNELINYYLNCFYTTRKQACDKINEKYGLNIKLRLNKDVLDLMEKDEEEIINYNKEEVIDNGTLYSNN